MGKRTVATEFGQRLQDARAHAGLSRRDVKEALGLGNSTIHDAETLAIGSKHTPRFARLFGVSAHWLATGEGEMLAGVSRTSYSLRRLAAVYRALSPEMRTVLLETARSLYKHARRTTAPVGPATPARQAQREKRRV